jgi:hypothetical protein
MIVRAGIEPATRGFSVEYNCSQQRPQQRSAALAIIVGGFKSGKKPQQPAAVQKIGRCGGDRFGARSAEVAAHSGPCMALTIVV